MFSALRQGSTVYIVEKTNEGLVYKTAQVSSVSSPQFNGNNYLSNPFNSTINITVNDIKKASYIRICKRTKGLFFFFFDK